MAIARIRKNDTVIVVSGNDAGKTGTVVRVDPKKGVAVVGGINVHKKAMRRTEKTPGGIIDVELPIRLCKLMPYDAEKKCGTRVRTGEKYRNVYHNYSENRLRLTGYVMLEKLVVDPARHASYYALTRQDLRRFRFVRGDAEGLVNMPLQMKGHKLSISLREDTEKDNLVWVSLRSVDDFPCNQVAAEFFNGGGHLNAAGGRLECSIDEAVRIAQQAILHYESLLK